MDVGQVWATLNYVFFLLYFLIFILCVRDNRSHSVLEIIGGYLVSPNYWYHSKYGIPGYERNNWYQSWRCLFKTHVL